MTAAGAFVLVVFTGCGQYQQAATEGP